MHRGWSKNKVGVVVHRVFQFSPAVLCLCYVPENTDIHEEGTGTFLPQESPALEGTGTAEDKQALDPMSLVV